MLSLILVVILAALIGYCGYLYFTRWELEFEVELACKRAEKATLRVKELSNELKTTQEQLVTLRETQQEFTRSINQLIETYYAK